MLASLLELGQCRLMRAQPLIGRLPGRPLGRLALGHLAPLAQALLGLLDAPLGRREPVRKAADQARLLVAQRLGLVALAPGHVELAAQVRHALLLALELARLPGQPRLALVERALAQ